MRIGREDFNAASLEIPIIGHNFNAVLSTNIEKNCISEINVSMREIGQCLVQVQFISSYRMDFTDTKYFPCKYL